MSYREPAPRRPYTSPDLRRVRALCFAWVPLLGRRCRCIECVTGFPEWRVGSWMTGILDEPWSARGPRRDERGEVLATMIASIADSGPTAANAFAEIAGPGGKRRALPVRVPDDRTVKRRM